MHHLVWIRRVAGCIASIPASAAVAVQLPITSTVCDEGAIALHTQAVPGGGTLSLGALPTAAALDAHGRVAFYGRVAGSPRNQGVFVVDAGVLHPIAFGSGGGLGSGNPGAAVGDPTPLGGRFAGFPPAGGGLPAQFTGLEFGEALVPALNANGDVLFLADVQGGSATRGLFLHRAATQTIVKVAANGDPLPGGGTLLGCGPGALNSSGSVVFVAYGASSADERILRWDNGVLAQVAALGDAAPSLGVYTWLGFAGYAMPDGTSLPVRPVPDINDRGSLCFVAYTSQLGAHGIVFDDGTGPQWYALVAQTITSAGNAVGECSAAVLNEVDDIAFYCSFWNGISLVPGGWLVGRAGQFREALVFNELLGSEPVVGLAASVNPLSPLSDEGDLVVWCTTQAASGPRDALVLSQASGARTAIRREGDASVTGGALTKLSRWPSINARGQVLSSSGIAGSVNAAHALLSMCVQPQSYCTPATTTQACSPVISSVGLPSASASSSFAVNVAGVAGQTHGLLFYGLSGRAAWPWAAGSTSWLCVSAPVQRTTLSNSGGTANACDGSLSLDLNAFRAAHVNALGEPLAAGQQLNLQAWCFDAGAVKSSNLSDALELWLAP